MTLSSRRVIRASSPVQIQPPARNWHYQSIGSASKSRGFNCFRRPGQTECPENQARWAFGDRCQHDPVSVCSQTGDLPIPPNLKGCEARDIQPGFTQSHCHFGSQSEVSGSPTTRFHPYQRIRSYIYSDAARLNRRCYRFERPLDTALNHALWPCDLARHAECRLIQS
jgi:hypothetical protein